MQLNILTKHLLYNLATLIWFNCTIKTNSHYDREPSSNKYFGKQPNLTLHSCKRVLYNKVLCEEILNIYWTNLQTMWWSLWRSRCSCCSAHPSSCCGTGWPRCTTCSRPRLRTRSLRNWRSTELYSRFVLSDTYQFRPYALKTSLTALPLNLKVFNCISFQCYCSNRV